MIKLIIAADLIACGGWRYLEFLKFFNQNSLKRWKGSKEVRERREEIRENWGEGKKAPNCLLGSLLIAT